MGERGVGGGWEWGGGGGGAGPRGGTGGGGADLDGRGGGRGGGLPLAAVTGRTEIMDSVHAGGLGGTYGGNPVACAAALGAIETMAAEDLAGKARRISEVMSPRLYKLAQTYPVIAEVRGRGAMLPIERTRPGTPA